MTPDDPYAGWVPIRVITTSSPPEVEWCHLGLERFTDSFFQQTIERRLRDPFPLLFRRRSPLVDLASRARSHPGLPPAGFLFHMSRCGSTLASRMFAAVPSTVVISEADPIDAVLRLPADDDLRIARLRGMIAALGQARLGDETHLIVKFDSWNIHDLPLIRRAFPNVPWAFLYRNPVEVLVSQIKQRAAYMIPGHDGRGELEPDATLEALTKPEQHCARVLGSFCRAALEHHRQDPGLLMNYSELPGAVESRLLDAFGINANDEDRERMKAATRFHAKNPALPFEPDSEAKNREASAQIRDMAELWVGAAYRELESARGS
jgi:hypothetical protein